MKTRRAFSIAEMMITLTIFSIVSMTAMNVLYNSMRASKNVQAQVFLYTEAQALMDQVARSIERNTIDYEAYYLREVQGETGWHSEEYGFYGQTFIDPGTGGPNSDLGPYGGIGYGTSCSEDSGLSFPEECTIAIADSTTADSDEGMHPYDTSIGDMDEWNAFCEDSASCPDFEFQVMDELILINTDGDERIIFGREDFDGTLTDYYLSKLEMTASDTDGDGIEDEWICNSRYTCTDTYGMNDVPNEDDLLGPTTDETSDGTQYDFMPLSPSTLSITEFHVILGPVEDPYRAFQEEDSQVQPQVTIVMTVALSDAYGGTLLGTPPSITFQRTVSTGVYSEVTSYE
jgi:prepilin-type N-terminal cleavage/methylation domain-containing protein